jgi:hypothetical protein
MTFCTSEVLNFCVIKNKDNILTVIGLFNIFLVDTFERVICIVFFT